MVRNNFPPIKDLRVILSESRIYKASCSCETLYIGEIVHSFSTRIKEHDVDIKYDEVVKISLMETTLSTKNHIFLESTKTISKEDNVFKRKLKENITINFHPLELNLMLGGL